MTAKVYNIQLEQGSRYSRVVQVNNDDGTPRNLTGYTAKLHVKASKEAGTTLLELATGDGLTINGVAGQITIDITSAETTAIAWSIGVYDLKIISGAEGERILEGAVSVSPQVTV